MSEYEPDMASEAQSNPPVSGAGHNHRRTAQSNPRRLPDPAVPRQRDAADDVPTGQASPDGGRVLFLRGWNGVGYIKRVSESTLDLTDMLDNSPENRALSWLMRNPGGVEYMRDKALYKLLRVGEHEMSVQGLIEVARWDKDLETRTVDSFKINNTFAPAVARYLMAIEPRLRGHITKKTSPRFDPVFGRLYGGKP